MPQKTPEPQSILRSAFNNNGRSGTAVSPLSTNAACAFPQKQLLRRRVLPILVRMKRREGPAQDPDVPGEDEYLPCLCDRPVPDDCRGLFNPSLSEELVLCC